jgi:hypothetical protein
MSYAPKIKTAAGRGRARSSTAEQLAVTIRVSCCSSIRENSDWIRNSPESSFGQNTRLSWFHRIVTLA